MALKTTYKDGDTIRPADLNAAFALLNKLQGIFDGGISVASVNDKNIIYDSNTTLDAADIKLSNGKTVETMVTDLSTQAGEANPAKVIVLQQRSLDDITTHGMYYVIAPSGGHPENANSDVYMQVIKTAINFFVQQCWTADGMVYTRIHNNSGYGAWKTL